MKVIGLLSTEEEANELKYIAQVRTVADRVHFIIHIHRVKQMLKETGDSNTPQT